MNFRHRNKIILRAAFLFAATAGSLFFFDCTTSLVDGGGTRGGNPVVLGRLVNTDGTPAPHVKVQLIPRSFIYPEDGPLPQSSVDTTDSLGMFSITAPGTGNFNLQGLHLVNQTRVLVWDINVFNDSMVRLTGILRKPGAIKVALSDSIDPALGYVYVPGTTISLMTAGSNGFAILDSVPAGEMPSINFSSINSSAQKVIRYNVHVVPEETTVVNMPGWRYSKRLFLNTTASGASVPNNVYNFPVLIRLNSLNFVFADANVNGREIRFTKSDGTTLLSYDIEQWDATDKNAAIWVKVDTVYGNNNVQSIIMYWGVDSTGSPQALTAGSAGSLQGSTSSGSTVFDTTQGFSAVWHLNANCNDQTKNTFNGTNYGATDTSGLIGQSKKFDGSDSIKINGLLNRPGSITLSAWVRCDTVLVSGGELISLGDHALIRADYTNGLPYYGVHASFFYGKPVDTFCSFETGIKIQRTGWRFIVFTFNNLNHTQLLYVDGVVMGRGSYNAPIGYDSLGANTFLGCHGNNIENRFNLSGLLDEARVQHVAVSADWITLCFKNQQTQDVLIKY